MELCPNWHGGHGCPCDVLDLEKPGQPEWVTDEVWMAGEFVRDAVRSAADFDRSRAEVVSVIRGTQVDGFAVVERFELDEWQAAMLEAYLAPVRRPLLRWGVLVPRSTGPAALCVDGREYRRRSRRRRR